MLYHPSPHRQFQSNKPCPWCGGQDTERIGRDADLCVPGCRFPPQELVEFGRPMRSREGSNCSVSGVNRSGRVRYKNVANTMNVQHYDPARAVVDSDHATGAVRDEVANLHAVHPASNLNSLSSILNRDSVRGKELRTRLIRRELHSYALGEQRARPG